MRRFIAAAGSTMNTSLKLYSRSKGLWFLLLAALLGARFWIPREDRTAVVIAIGQHLPVMTSAMLGTSLGVVTTTLLLPLGFIYLRSNTTRRQPWQVEEVTPASRVAIALGRSSADAAIFVAVLAVMSIAGWLLAWLTMPPAAVRLLDIAVPLALVGVPGLVGLAALRVLLDSLPWTRRAFGEVVFFALWIVSLAGPVMRDTGKTGFKTNMLDFGGFTQPLSSGSQAGARNLQIGFGGSLLPGRVPVDVMRVLLSKPYLEARLAWTAIALGVAILSGFLYRPHAMPKRSRHAWAMPRWVSLGPPPRPNLPMRAAAISDYPGLGVLWAEFRLISPGRIFLTLNVLLGLSGLWAEYRHVVSPAILLLLTFGLTAQAGREEARGLAALTSTTVVTPALRRTGFIVAGTAWSLLLSTPALVVHRTLQTLSIAIAIGLGASLFTIAIAAFSHSAFAPRLLLLILWYAYIAA